MGLEVLEVRAAVRDHLEEAAARVNILPMLFEVGRELADLLREQGNLDRGGPGVGLMLADGLHGP